MTQTPSKITLDITGMGYTPKSLDQIEYLYEMRRGYFGVVDESNLYKMGGYGVSYKGIIIAARPPHEKQTSFEQIFETSTGTPFRDHIHDLAKHCGGEVFEEYQKLPDGGTRLTYDLIITTKEQFDKAVEWLEPKILAWEILEASGIVCA